MELQWRTDYKSQTTWDAVEQVRHAQALIKRDRKRGYAALNEIFRAGVAPDPALNGPYRGELVALDIAPGINQFVETMTALWFPWRGKFFDAAHSNGDNISTSDSLTLAHVFWPLYRGYKENGADTYRAFTFQTRIAPGFVDPDRQVLKLDYDLADNPSLSIRRVLDELVQIQPGFYLGKAHLHWLWGAWQLVAFLSLAK